MSDRGSSAPSLRWIFVAWLAIGLTFVTYIVFGMIERGDPTEAIERLFGDSALFAFLVYTAGLVFALLVLRRLLRRSGFGWRDVGLRGRLTGRGALFAVGGWFVAFWLYYLVEKTTGAVGLRMFWNEEAFFGLHSVARVIGIGLSTLVIAPVAEEIIYRGYLIPAIRAKAGTALAVLLSSLIFASVHIGIGPGMAIYIFLGAFIPAYLFLRFDNIYPCILMHLINNMVAYFVIPLAVGA